MGDNPQMQSMMKELQLQASPAPSDNYRKTFNPVPTVQEKSAVSEGKLAANRQNNIMARLSGSKNF